MDKDFAIFMLLTTIWTIGTFWFWTLVPISLRPGDPHALAWIITALMVWLCGFSFLVGEPWKKRS